MAHENLSDAQVIAEMAAWDADSHEAWHEFDAWNQTSHYGFGTSDQAKAYCDYLNRGRDVGLYSANKMAYEDALALERGDDTDGFRLDLALDTIADNDAFREALCSA